MTGKEGGKDLEGLTVVQLREMLRDRGLKVSGIKAELVERLGREANRERAVEAAVTSSRDGFILQFDGGSRGNPGPAACGYALFSPDGLEVASGWMYLGESRTNNYAEYSGLTLGLRKAMDLGVKGVAQGDSKLVVEQMKGNWKVKNKDMKALKAEADTVAEGWGFEWIRRELNKRADALANQGMDDGGRIGKFEAVNDEGELIV